MIVCKYCGLTETTYYKLKKHIARDHTETNTKIQCDKCMKELSSTQTLKSHKITCDGLTSLQCQYCSKTLSNRYSKYRHKKVCQNKQKEANKEADKEEINTLPSITNNTNNYAVGNLQGDHNTINNNNTNNTNNITNYNTNNITNNNNSIMLFDKDSYISFDASSMDIEDNVSKVDCTDDRSHIGALYNFSNILFSIPKNRCVKKTNLKMRHSKVHTGDNRWETLDDSFVYDKLVKDISITLMNKLDECEDSGTIKGVNKRKLHYLRGKTEPFTNKIYDDEIDLIRQLRIIKTNIKNILHSYSGRK